MHKGKQKTTKEEFRKIVWDYYKKHKRPMWWRSDTQPYYIVVSEIMLQQTQVDRVMDVFPLFIKKFPSLRSLARASRTEVLSAWQGLGYNRRAVYVHQIAKEIVRRYRGILPSSIEELEKLPGIGPNTAASIYVFAYNMPAVFIETNIRTVFLFHFFKNKKNVLDKDIVTLIEETLSPKDVREWYWALMDYGSYLKKIYGNQNRRSKHYVKQAKFEGSNRQLRGMIIKFLLKHKASGIKDIAEHIQKSVKETERVCSRLVGEGIVSYNRERRVYRV